MARNDSNEVTYTNGQRPFYCQHKEQECGGNCFYFDEKIGQCQCAFLGEMTDSEMMSYLLCFDIRRRAQGREPLPL